MPLEKVNVYAGYSYPIMGIDSFGMHTINLLHGATSIIQLGCRMLQILSYCCSPINKTKLLGQEVNLHPK